MRLDEFDKILTSRLMATKNVLNSKSREYVVGDDKLYNFKRAALLNRTSTRKALWGMATKHLVSIIDIVESNTIPPVELFTEKIGDMINYLILLEAIIHEENNETVNSHS